LTQLDPNAILVSGGSKMPVIGTVAQEIRRKLGNDSDIDLEYLAQLFEDGTIADSGGAGNELQQRVETILTASSSGANGGVTHFSGIFAGTSDKGFREAFQDPRPSGSNQVGHFMTAVDMGYRPMKTYRLIPAVVRNQYLDGTTHSVLPVEERVCIGLIIGHEQVGDTTWQANYFATIQASSSEIQAFLQALEKIGASPDWDVARSRTALSTIRIGSGVGNSMQDLHLSLYGYRFGRFIRKGELTSRAHAAQWLRTDIGGNVADLNASSGSFAAA
jgi:hypothetical protein